MQFNFFQWLREGVKQSILLGVSDAVEEVGMPPDNEEMSQRLQTALKHDGGGRKAIGGGPSEGGKKNKRLGRSLKDFDGEDQGGEKADAA